MSNLKYRLVLIAGLPMALATSSSRSAVELKSSPHPWLQLITVRVHGDDPQLRQGKPAPDVFLLAAERLGANPAECWAFEDSLAGCLSAHAAGCLVHVLLPPEEEGEVDLARELPAGCKVVRHLSEVVLEP